MGIYFSNSWHWVWPCGCFYLQNEVGGTVLPQPEPSEALHVCPLASLHRSMRKGFVTAEVPHIGLDASDTLFKSWPNVAHHLFLSIKFYWTTARPFICMLSVAAFALQWHSSCEAKSFIGLTKTKIFTTGPFTEKVCPSFIWLIAWTGIISITHIHKTILIQNKI